MRVLFNCGNSISGIKRIRILAAGERTGNVFKILSGYQTLLSHWLILCKYKAEYNNGNVNHNSNPFYDWYKYMMKEGNTYKIYLPTKQIVFAHIKYWGLNKNSGIPVDSRKKRLENASKVHMKITEMSDILIF